MLFSQLKPKIETYTSFLPVGGRLSNNLGNTLLERHRVRSAKGDRGNSKSTAEVDHDEVRSKKD
jgi:hypothetical protein